MATGVELKTLYGFKFAIDDSFVNEYGSEDPFWNALATTYTTGATKTFLDNLFTGGKAVDVYYAQGDFSAQPAGNFGFPGSISVDLSVIEGANGYYFDNVGRLQKYSLGLSLFHEISHAADKNSTDGVFDGKTGWGFDQFGNIDYATAFSNPKTTIATLRGTTVDQQNTFARDAGLGQQVSYYGVVVSQSELSDVGISYTNGATIDTALVDRDSFYTNSTPPALTVIDLSILGSSRDLVLGMGGNDKILGGGGNDHLWGGDGNDILAGGSGSDRLIGGNGADVLNGYDDALVSTSTSADTMDGQSGGDWYFMSITDTARDTGIDKADDRFYYSNYFNFSDSDGIYTSYYRGWSAATIPNDPLPISGGNRVSSATQATNGETAITTQDAIRAGLLHGEFTDTGTFAIETLTELGGGEISAFNWADGDLHLDVGREALSTVGTSGNDELEGTRGADILIGGAGNDEIEGKSGDDELSGEEGNDELEGGKGNDKLYGDRGDDKLDGGDGNDSLWGGNGNDRLEGGKGNDMLSGNQGDDILRGGEGMDRLLGGVGGDIMTGGEGRDTFVFHFGDGADIITDFSGARGRGEGGHGGRHGGGGHDDDYRSGDLIEISSDLSGFDVFADILAHASQVGDNAVIDFGGGDTLTLQHTRVTSLHADSFAFI
jgi:Ca2+-binding RTX toxin-like protein